MPGTLSQAPPSAMAITVNGEARSLPASLPLSDFLAQAGLDLRKVAVERNEEIVPRSAYATTLLEPGDQLEIVHFIGGG
nr:sulfur carrier protein ThiS [Roseomonas sp. SXEYE001]